jgi:CheY-like chemotaxis protein
MGLPLEADEMAEGSPGGAEERDPASPLKTTINQVVADDIERATHAAETGIVSAVALGGEGKDDGESQDASRTTDEAQQMPDPVRKAALLAGKTPVVLIIEDATELAEVIQATLERMDMEIVHETHGNKALAKFTDLNPDILLLDISLPDMTGWHIMDVIKERYQSGDTSSLPIVIVITAYDDPANRLVGKLQGVHSYLIKPFTSDEIERTVENAISSATR